MSMTTGGRRSHRRDTRAGRRPSQWMPPAPGLTRTAICSLPTFPVSVTHTTLAPYSISTHAHANSRTLEPWVVRPVLMGNSLGALVTIQMPPRVPDLVDRLVWWLRPHHPGGTTTDRSGGGKAASGQGSRPRAGGGQPILEGNHPGQPDAGHDGRCLCPPRKSSAGDHRTVAAIGGGPPSQPWALDSLVKSTVGGSVIAAGRGWPEPWLGLAPTLIIQGARDRVVLPRHRMARRGTARLGPRGDG